MLKSLALVAALSGLSILSVTAFAPAAHADASTELYNCVFTTPYVHVSFNTDADELVTYTQEGYVEREDGSFEEVPQIESDVTMSTDAAGRIHLTNRFGTVLYSLTQTDLATDGMSNAVYPYEVVANTAKASHAGHIGACYSTSKPKLQED